MLDSEVRQLEILAALDDLRLRVEKWLNEPSVWRPVQQSQSLMKRVLGRVETLRVRMEAPLVVATFGGTGTGKSTLVNALVGEEVSTSGRQRPTTHRPVLIAHPDTDLVSLGFPLDEVDIVQRDVRLLRDVVLLDCPDPDTTEENIPGSNLDRLRTLIPYCDVLLYVSTQQKYRSARVAQELSSAASGCRILFVQTHADLDEDIREDWKRTLASDYSVPEVFFVDSQKALKEQQAGQPVSGEMGELLDLLLNKLRASERVRVRRANVLDLLDAGLSRCQEILREKQPAVDELKSGLAQQQQAMSQRMAEELQKELLSSHALWERRLLGAVTEQWGMSPFCFVLKTYHSLGSLLASTALFRARSTAQIALLGTVQGMRWWEGKRKEQAVDASLQRASHFGMNETLLHEAEIVIEGHLTEAGFDHSLIRHSSSDEMRQLAIHVEDQFLENARRQIDEIIAELSQKNSHLSVRIPYEILFGGYLLFVIGRAGKNFFYDSFFLGKDLLSSDFYIAAALFLVLWCGVLLMFFTRRLQFGLRDRIRQLASRLVETRLGRGTFPQLENALRQSERATDEVAQLLSLITRLRHQSSHDDRLGAPLRHASSR